MSGDDPKPARTLSRALPGLSVLLRYRRGWLRPDVLAGVTVAAYLVPQVMAYAEVAGLAPVAGLWAITGSLLVYAVLGSSRQLSVGPESTTALMTAVAIGPLAAADPARYAALAAVLALLVGAICVLGWIARLGVLADLLSRPVLVGYMAGIAVVMIVSQLGKIGRLSVHGDSVLASLRSFVDQLDQVRLPTLALAAAVLAFLLISSQLFAKLPVPLFGVLLATAATALFSLRPWNPGGRRDPRGISGAGSACGVRRGSGDPAAAGDRGGDRGLQRQRAHRPRVRLPQPAPGGRQRRTARPRHSQRRFRSAAWFSGQQQRQPHSHR